AAGEECRTFISRQRSSYSGFEGIVQFMSENETARSLRFTWWSVWTRKAGQSLVMLVLVVACMFAAPSAQFRVGNGTIRGRVELRRPPPAQEPRPNVSGFGTITRGEAPDRRRSVVYLETAPRGAFEQAETGRVTMNQRDETFVPHVIAITTG